MKQKTPTRKELEKQLENSIVNAWGFALFALVFLIMLIAALVYYSNIEKELTQCQADKIPQVRGDSLWIDNQMYNFLDGNWYQNGTRLMDHSKEYSFWLKVPPSNKSFCIGYDGRWLSILNNTENCEVVQDD